MIEEEKNSIDEEVLTAPIDEFEQSLMDDERAVIKNVEDQFPKQAKGAGPLDQPVIERNYNTEVYSGDIHSPIEEPKEAPKFIPTDSKPENQAADRPPLQDKKEAKYNFSKENEDAERYAREQLGEKHPDSAPGNPAVTTMGAKERKASLAMTVDNAIAAYAKVKHFFGSFLKIGEARLIKRQASGKAPAGWAVLHDQSSGRTMSLMEFVFKTNEYIEKACETDDDFKNTIRPMLESEFDKRGWIATPQQNIFYLIGQDLFMMGQKLVTLHMNVNNVLKKADEEFDRMKIEGELSARELYNMNLIKPNIENFRPPAASVTVEPKPKTESKTESKVSKPTPTPPPAEKQVEVAQDPEFVIPD